jgi:DNA-binding MarR family transcriptional regulator
MDTDQLRTLRLLEEIEQNHAPSQRYLAKQLNVSLGLVNSFIRRLAQKGYFKITTIPKNRVKYILTPEGAAQKTKLTYEYIHYSYQFYKDARRKIRHIFQDLVKEGVRTVIFYGIGHFAEIAYISLQETPMEMVAMVDDFKKGERFMGFNVDSPRRINFLVYDRIIVTAISSRVVIHDKLHAQGVPADKIVTIDIL